VNTLLLLPSLPHAQRGMALIEALVASAVLGIGLLGATQLTLKSLHLARENRQHTEAQHLAQEAMDCLRRPQAVCPSEEVIVIQGVVFTRQSQSTFQGDAWSQDLRVRVSWAVGSTKPGNAALKQRQQLEWHSRASALPDWVGVSSP
jgi:prepilin-type N-terminal cleavage/methylation domain-containing protein